MSMPTVMVVVGTRPEAIKLAPVIQALSRKGARVRVCLTGQHRELLHLALAPFGIEIAHDLDLMLPGQDLSGLTSRILSGIAQLLPVERPDWVVVQGDTVSALGGALAAYQARIPVAHVEAGLRTGNLEEPWPEEMNRRLIGQLASLHFAPTPQSRENLLRENIAAGTIHVTGNTVIDSALMASDLLTRDPAQAGPLAALLAGKGTRHLLLATVHRRENHGPRLIEIGTALARLSERRDVCVLLPAHPNPRLQPLFDTLAGTAVQVVEPLPYLPFMAALRSCSFILTDSGGVQEEASAFGKPVLVLRPTTERPEILEGGNGRLVGTRTADILAAATELLDDPAVRAALSRRHDAFGDGQAGDRIATHLTQNSSRHRQ